MINVLSRNPGLGMWSRGGVRRGMHKAYAVAMWWKHVPIESRMNATSFLNPKVDEELPKIVIIRIFIKPETMGVRQEGSKCGGEARTQLLERCLSLLLKRLGFGWSALPWE